MALTRCDYFLLSDEDSIWWWTLLTDPQVVAAIIGSIGTVVAACQCCKLVLVICTSLSFGLFILLVLLGSSLLSPLIASKIIAVL